MDNTTTRPRYPYIDNRWPRSHHGDPAPDPAIGTVAELDDGVVEIHVGSNWPTDLVDVDALASQYRQAARIRLYGHVLHACRPARQAIYDTWRATDRATRRAAQPPRPIDLTKPRKARCGQPTRDGEPCRRVAGAGTDIRTGPCVDHGGSGERRQAAAKKLREQSLLVDVLTAKARLQPPTLREQLDGLIAVREVLIATEELQPYRRRR